MTTRPALGGLLRVAAIALGVVCLLAALIGSLGGFAPAADGARPRAVGEEVELQRWNIAVERAAYTSANLNGDEDEPSIRVPC